MKPHQITGLSAAQIRAARGLRALSQNDLAAASGLSIATIRKLEDGHISPRADTARLIKQAFEDRNVEFTAFNGVRDRPEEVTIYQGRERVRDFYDDVYQTVSKRGGDIVIVATDPNLLFNMMEDYALLHRERMAALKKIVRVRCLMSKEASDLPAPEYCEYRKIAEPYADTIPFYVYGDKYAIRTVKSNPSPKIVVVQSLAVADSFRQQFESMWSRSTPIATGKKTGSVKKK